MQLFKIKWANRQKHINTLMTISITSTEGALKDTFYTKASSFGKLKLRYIYNFWQV